MGIFDFLKRTPKESVPQPPKEEIEDIELPQYLKTKVHGQTATLVDMLIELNKREHFTSPEEAVSTLFEYIEHLRKDGDSVAEALSNINLMFLAGECFSKGQLDIDMLQQKLDSVDVYHFGPHLSDQMYTVYKHYVVGKIVTLVGMLNEIQCYRSYCDVGSSIREDFYRAVGTVSGCSSNHPDNYYFAFGSPTGSGKVGGILNKVYSYFQGYVNRYWSEFAPNGTLDNALFREFMIERHEKAVEECGIEAVIRMNYHHACGRAFLPNDGWVGPVYVKVDDSRKYIKSCGDGRGPNEFPNYFEMKFLKKIIVDCNGGFSYDGYVNSFTASLAPYCFYDRYDEEVFKYSIPVNSYSSLPIYYMQTGEKQFFDSQKDKAKFIIKMKLGMGESIRCPLPPYLEKEHLKQELMELAESEEEREQIKEEFPWIYWD